ncbi:hypothetical protein N7532_008307 [Penicillium argentinense]|uniref:Uncharacterized protein n=1 Tax=Penicillium argentinense TaxID=1131581 RepID=A0A9W9K1H7_9EURO|nr:uncharacterized protein N7532_008307 [Penicillium argentinense]KAJ5089623.1 hypothetical protein N7532_008307 [Penicillium argentinense]
MSCLQPPGNHRTIPSRPKLTLQTTSLPLTFGSSTTGLSRYAASAGASPTVRNTFKNAYDVVSPSSATSSPSKTTSSHRFPTGKPISPYVHQPASNPSTTNTFNYRSAYQLPIGVRSILRNSPLEGASRRRSGSISAGACGPGGAGARRVFFPAKKSVSFRNTLEEEIRTERYTAQHLDLVREGEEAEAVHEADNNDSGAVSASHTAESPDDYSEGSLSLSESSTSDEGSTDETSASDTSLSKLERKKRRTMRAERQVRAVALLDGLEADPYASTPQTPRQGRVKRRRDWRWTLGPIEGSPDSATASTHADVPSFQVPLEHIEQPVCVLAGPQPDSKFQ